MPHSSENTHAKHVVLSLSGHDPTGGAGIQADAEVISHFGCHPCSVITCLTVQDSRTVYRLMPLPAGDIIKQAAALFNDMPIAVIKVGLTGSLEAVNAIVDILHSHPSIPVVFDPVLGCGDGTPLANEALISTIKNKLLPLSTVLTPNTIEANKLLGLSNTVASNELGAGLLNLGCDYVLVTGGHTEGRMIVNELFHKQQRISAMTWPRQAGEFHGTGCTLASAIAALIAQGHSIPNAVELAQAYTNDAITQANRLGKGQLFLNRIQ